MGQQVVAIVYGVAAEYSTLKDDDGEWLDGKPEDIETGDSDNFRCIGITLAVQNVNEDGEAELPEGPLSDIADTLQDQIAVAKDRWKSVVIWAKSHKVKLDKPQLLLVTIERA